MNRSLPPGYDANSMRKRHWCWSQGDQTLFEFCIIKIKNDISFLIHKTINRGTWIMNWRFLHVLHYYLARSIGMNNGTMSHLFCLFLCSIKKIWAINLISRNSSISLIQKQMKYNSSNSSRKSYHWIAKTYVETGSIWHNFVYDHNLKKRYPRGARLFYIKLKMTTKIQAEDET